MTGTIGMTSAHVYYLPKQGFNSIYWIKSLENWVKCLEEDMPRGRKSYAKDHSQHIEVAEAMITRLGNEQYEDILECRQQYLYNSYPVPDHIYKQLIEETMGMLRDGGLELLETSERTKEPKQFTDNDLKGCNASNGCSIS